ncbi:MAG: hypothetical protein AAGH15_01455 [Myxococcota bacterium]
MPRSALIVATLAVFACGSPAEEDSASLCTADRDPRPWLCNDRARVDLLSVAPLARAFVGPAPLVRVGHRPGMDLNGRAPSWSLTFVVDGGLTELMVSADGNVGERAVEGELVCDPVGLEPVDSVLAVRAAVRRYEDSEGPFAVGPDTSLLLIQSDGCFLWNDEPVGDARRVRIAQPGASWFAELDAAGNVREWLGPCARDARIGECREDAGRSIR